MSSFHVRRDFVFSLSALLVAGLVSRSQAINITVQYDGTQAGAVSPAFDPNGTQLLAIANYAASFYEDVFEDNNHSLTLTFWYTDLNGLLGDHDNISEDANQRESVGNIKIDTQDGNGVARNYFFDPTPASNSEYTMTQSLWRGISAANRADWYIAGAGVPATLETGFTGTAPAGSPAAGALDMLSLVFHEMGHSLGMSSGIPLTVAETNDNDYDINPAFIFGGTLAADTLDRPTDFIGHIDDPSNLMNPGLGGAGSRTLPSHVDLFAMAAGHQYTLLDVPRREFYNPNGDWNADANWSGNNTPDNADDTFVRNDATAILSGFGAAGNLFVDEGALVSTQTHTLFVQNATTVGGTAGLTSQITINTGGELDSDVLNINNDGRVVLVGATSLLQSERVNIASGGELRGRGTVDLNDNVLGLLTSEGLIQATAGGELLITSQNGLGLDLAGGDIEAIDGNIRFETGMATAMGADVTIGAGREVAFNSGGSAGAGSLIDLQGAPGNPATISGSNFFVGLNATINANGLGIIENTLLLQPSGAISTEFGDANSEIRLAGTTFFQGGRILGDGIARQVGNAFVQQDTEISIDTYDMDGLSGNTILTVNAGRTLEVTSDHIDTVADNDFDGTLNINSGVLDITSAWRLDGVLNLNETTTANPVLQGAGGVTVDMGGQINITGEADVDTKVQVNIGKIFVDGDATFSGPTTLGVNADVEINNADDSLRLMGNTILVNPSIVGSGRIVFDGNVNVAFFNTSIGTAETDLDGILGNTEVLINQGLTFSIASTTIEPTANDGFDGTIINRGTFSVLAGWRLDGEFEMDQIGATVPALAGLGPFRIHTTGTYSTDGDSIINPPLQVAGMMDLGAGVTRVNSTAAFESTASVTVAQGGKLELSGVTTFQGGSYTGSGLIQFNAMTSVNANTTIATGRVDLDGAAETTQTTLNDSALVLNVDGVDAINSIFSSTLNATGANARLEVNLTNPLAGWRLGSTGVLNLTTPAPAASPSIMLAGNDVSVEGRINATGNLRLGANVAVTGRIQTVTNSTDVHFSGGGVNLVFNTAIIGGTGDITIDNRTQLFLQDDTNVGVDVENVGRLEVGFQPTEVGLDLTETGNATIRGNFSQASGGEYGVELGGGGGGLPQADQYDVLNITGTARLNGLLAVELINGFLPAVGNAFTVLTAGAVVGTFDTVTAFDTAGMFDVDVSVLYSAVDAVVRIDGLFLLGDYNKNGVVDAADYALWRDTQGKMGTDLAADGNGNGVIDAGDYAVWRAHFGNSFGLSPATGSQSVATSASALGNKYDVVPEPTSWWLVVIALSTCLAVNRWRVA